MRCAVFGCRRDNQTKNFDRNIRFFSFPRDKDIQLEWIRFCKREDNFNVTFARICSEHFNKDDYVRNLQHELLGYSPRKGRGRALKEEAIPSKHLPLPRKDTQNSGRDYRQEKKRKRQLVEGLIKGTDICDDGCGKGLGGLSDHGFAECNDYVTKISTGSRSIGIDTDSKVDRDEVIANLREKITFLEKRQALVGKLFSTEQLKMLKGGRRLRWSVEDISNALSIYSDEPRSYQMLLRKGYPFPNVYTLRTWLKKNKVKKNY